MNNEPAFPSLHYKAVELGEEGRDYASFEGMSLMDYFAAKIMEGICANPDISSSAAENGLFGKKLHPFFAKSAYELADAMLKERENWK